MRRLVSIYLGLDLPGGWMVNLKNLPWMRRKAKRILSFRLENPALYMERMTDLQEHMDSDIFRNAKEQYFTWE